MNTVDDEWLEFLQNPEMDFETDDIPNDNDKWIPECNELNISTNTKVLYLNQKILIRHKENIPIVFHQEK